MDAVTPAGLPQEPKPYEEVKLWYAISMRMSSGPGGGFRRGLSSVSLALPRSRPFLTTSSCSSRCISLTLRHRVPLPGPAVWTHGGVEGVPFLAFVFVPISLALESLDYV